MGNVIALKDARLARAATDIAQVVELLGKHGLDDGKPIIVVINGEEHLLIFGKLEKPKGKT